MIDLGAIVLERFTRQRDDLYQVYRRLKYQVFVIEGGWDSLKDESGEALAREDPFDACGRFWLARTPDGVPVGVVRGIRLQDGFPHREMLQHHLSRFREDAAMSVCTLNALAVLPDYRGRPYEVPPCGWRGTVAKLLLLAIVRSLEAEGQRAALATCAGLRSARVCIDAGFSVLDPPTRTSLHPSLMINVGMVFESPAHVKAQQSCGIDPLAHRSPHEDTQHLQAYFSERHRLALDSKALESYFV
jgi:hypothetical protein